ncbi:gfo/Idh/MocA family oxidoreductase [Sinorhizobium medicae]|uniref:1-carboxy-3-chloro-3,4-dihydroxycyclo hexa-1,5-diene dehydrogenase n=2 Tax=Sinorhizobium medicae TaxID=110321 RepID=A0A508WT55_9HYPH|nr:Gfo/Idh/MocA family oxidoreductase [Sinorhizobium medicae]ABR62379.1 oxidoreductase domain protein [Sinorhizobium medicae WSM419]MBO1963986.1 Gfo/Idh/MocA family oxidoreductase [Sinorhizobium medicae]MDX0412800.1 gfo/Idh/MocA family oxidoreductase [Sinorhizobium medicae]MDX0422026.1 gfo/Idh/MocA family oxidoreductase [Sinorhizobium medicae]MDX0437463.1 gfo/Idh/MocA family oxidoreductase [Sinorhizobium medicae]
MSGRRRLGIGLIGTGFMGKAHALGFTIAARVFDLPFELDLVSVADVTVEGAEAARGRLGFRKATTDWRDLLIDPEIDVIDITTPNLLHKEMALAAIAHGKHVYCEKPLAPTVADCAEMVAAAEKAGVVTQLGFNYLKNPLIFLARDIIESGEIGEIRSFRGVHAEDFMADRTVPWGWRLDPRSGGGALADIGSHMIACMRHLVGPVRSVLADSVIHVAERPLARGATETRAVEVDDVTRAFVRFESGASGSFEANWIATGRKMQHDFEIYGSKGSIVFTQERLNEIKIYYAGDDIRSRGFRTIWAGPEHPPYGAFCVAPGHQIGFNDLKAIEVHEFLEAIANGVRTSTDFREGYEVQKVLSATYHSARTNAWVEIG